MNQVSDVNVALFSQISGMVNVMSGLALAIAVIVIIIGGFKYVVSDGEREKSNSAKNLIFIGGLGMVIATFAFAMGSVITPSNTAENIASAEEGTTKEEKVVTSESGSLKANILINETEVVLPEPLNAISGAYCEVTDSQTGKVYTLVAENVEKATVYCDELNVGTTLSLTYVEKDGRSIITGNKK